MASSAQREPSADRWTLRSPSVGASGRAVSALALALSAAAGTASARQCGDGWTYLAPSMGMTATDSEVVYDSGRDRLVFYRGSPGDTWEFDFATLTWSFRTAQGPGGRVLFGMAYDSARAVTVLHGGMPNSGALDTWEWDGAAWTLRWSVAPGDYRQDPTLVFDPITASVMAYGGSHFTGGFGWSIGANLGFWNGSAWQGQGTPAGPTIIGPSLAADPVSGLYLITGGRIPTGGGGSTTNPASGTAVRPVGGQWTTIEPWGGGGSGGTGVIGLAFYDPASASLMRERNGALQRWNGATWDALESGLGDGPRAITFDAGRGRLISVSSAFGGPPGVLVRDLVPMAPQIVSGSAEPPALAIGGVIDLTANVAGVPGWTAQWYRNGVAMVNGPTITGATTAHLTSQIVSCDDYADYEIVVTHACGNDSREWAVRSFVVATSRLPAAPNLNPGAAVQFFAVVTDANGATSHAYQWRRNGVNVIDAGAVSGATTPTLTINGAHHEHEGVYDVVVSIACGGARTSAPVALGIVCHGDANDDGMVTFADLNLVLSNFGAAGPAGSVPGDVTGNGVVNFEDLNLVLGFFGQAC